MSRYIFTILGLLVFVFTALALDVMNLSVSPETLLQRYHETFLVKQGVSSDGTITIISIPDLNISSAQKTFSNSTRNLRAFVLPDPSGEMRLYLEKAKPHGYFMVIGEFVISPAITVPSWVKTNVLRFQADSNGTLTTFEINVSELSGGRIKNNTMIDNAKASAAFDD